MAQNASINERSGDEYYTKSETIVEILNRYKSLFESFDYVWLPFNSEGKEIYNVCKKMLGDKVLLTPQSCYDKNLDFPNFFNWRFDKGKEQSNNYRKQRLVVAKIHEKISNQRKDYLHKLTTYLATTYEIVCIEDLSINNMVKNHNLALAINDCGWGMFKEMLKYKVKDLRIIGRFEPSSKTCNICGDINKNLKLSDRNWTCKNGHNLDRDLNAAINIKNFGLRASTLNVKTDC